MKVVEFTIDEEAEDYGVFAISLVEQPAIEGRPVSILESPQ